MATIYPDFFNDVFGPVMQPGSSSHTAAPCRIGLLARDLLGEKLLEAHFIMDLEGSFAGTFGIMKEDRGMLAGVLGIGPEDIRLYDAPEIAEQEGITYHYIFDEMKESDHLNALKIILKGVSGKVAELVGDSTGGGMIRIRKINGFSVDLIGDTFVVLVAGVCPEEDLQRIQGELAGFVEHCAVQKDSEVLNLLKFSDQPDLKVLQRVLTGSRHGSEAATLELIQKMQREYSMLFPVLPVISRKDKKKQLFRTVAQWRDVAQARGISMSRAALEYEMDSSSWPEEKVLEYMEKLKEVLHHQIEAAYDTARNREYDPFHRYDSSLWTKYQTEKTPLSGFLIADIIRGTVGVNEKTKGIPIVPGPMGTGGGYLFSALTSVQKAFGYSEEDLLRGLFVAAGIGAISYTHTSPTGEVVGCGGECGVCCAMGAAAIVEMCGGDGYQLEHAASLALQAFIGLPCDPVVGGYEAPCFSRVVAAASLAVVYADLALAGVTTVIPYDEMVSALDQIGRNMPSELLCTSRGGCCTTPAARKCREEFEQYNQKNQEQRQNKGGF